MQVWFLADSRTAYCDNLDIYSDKRVDNVDAGVGVTHATVMRMVQPCVDRGYYIYFDNYYTSPALLKYLSSKGFGACGTLHVNRKCVPRVIKSAKVKPDNPLVSVHHDGVTYISWTDKRQVSLATIIHDDSLFGRQQRNDTKHKQCLFVSLSPSNCTPVSWVVLTVSIS